MPHSCELSVTGFFSLGFLRTKEFVFLMVVCILAIYDSNMISLYNLNTQIKIITSLAIKISEIFKTNIWKHSLFLHHLYLVLAKT